MGCGCGTKRPTDQYVDLSTANESSQRGQTKPEPEIPKQLGEIQAPVKANGANTRNVQTTSLTGQGATQEECKCKQYENSVDDESKTHMLECSHRLCPSCARQEIVAMLLGKSRVIEFTCKLCKAPKALSKAAAHPVETILLSCGCLEDVLQLDRTIRGVSSPDKIVGYDIASSRKECTTLHRHPQSPLWREASHRPQRLGTPLRQEGQQT